MTQRQEVTGDGWLDGGVGAGRGRRRGARTGCRAARTDRRGEDCRRVLS